MDHKGFMSSYLKSREIHFFSNSYFNDLVRSQLAHVTTAELSWHVQNCDLIGSLFFFKGQDVFSWNLDYGLMIP